MRDFGVSKSMLSTPPPVSLGDAPRELRERGFAFVHADSVTAALPSTPGWVASWRHLPPDPHLADGGKYRFRRHASYIQTISPPALLDVPYRPHWQPKAFNKLHGGMHRAFEPIDAADSADPAFRALITRFGHVFAEVSPTPKWFVEAHQFRIDASRGEGRPTPEGAHRDGVDFVALVLVDRGDIAGGATTIHADDGSTLAEVTLSQSWTAMLLDDRRVIHATTPIKPIGPHPHRDTLVLTYRAEGFLEPK